MKIAANGISTNCTLDGPAGVPVVALSHSLATDLSRRDPVASRRARRERRA